jgi:hypothetical protein
MNAQFAFEMKPACPTLFVVDLYRRIQACVVAPAQPWRWLRRRRVRSTMTVRQEQQRLQFQSTGSALRHVGVDVILSQPVSLSPVRHS